MTIRLADLDPFGGLGDEPLEKKMTHHWEDGQRVRLRPSGRTGKIKTINNRGDLNIMLDSGHFVQCRDTDDCEPEDWAETAPHPELQESDEPEKVLKFSDASRELLGPFAKMSGGLVRAAEAGTMSLPDRVLALRCMKTLSENRQAIDPFGETEPEEIRLLKILAEKYSSTPARETVNDERLAKSFRRTKRSRSDFHIGQKVRNPLTGEVATVTKVEDDAIAYDYGNGTGLATFDSIEPLEAAA